MKKTLSGFIAVCLVLSLFTGVFVSMPSAKAASEGGFTYDIVGTAPNQTATITKYTGGSGVVVIPGTLGGYPVTSIGDEAFYECSFLTSVTIPDSVTRIGDAAFFDCSSLTGITIPNSVTSIGTYAFRGCSSLTSVTIGNGVTGISYDAFYYCSSLTSITVDPANGSYSSIDGVLFNKTATLLIQYPGSKQGAYVIPTSVTSIGDDAFAWCSSLISVTIPNSVTSIGDSAFSICLQLTAAYFLGNAPTMGTQAFYSCASGFTVYYVSGTTGWSNPWYGYPTATFVPGDHTLTVNVTGFGSVAKSPDAASYPFGTVVTLTATANPAYHFSSWTGATPVTGHPDQATVTMDADKTVTAAFTINTYTVTFNSEGGSAVASQSVAYGALVTKPADPTKAGSTFGGWYKEEACTTPWVFATDTVTTDTTLYAKWTINAYTVTFNSEGGSAVASQSVAYGGKVTEPTAPTKAGSTFGGWYKEEACTTLWDFATDTVTTDTTLYAKWTINAYTLTTSASPSAGGTVTRSPDAASYAAGTVVTLTAIPATGYTFSSWTGANPVTGHPDQATVTMDADKTVTATFTINAYTVTFNSEGGSAVASQSVAYGGKVTEPAAPTKAGSTFGGWYKEEACTTPWDFANDTVTTDTTLYAKWTINAYTVTFNSEGGSAVDPQSVPYGALVTEPTAPTKAGSTLSGWYKDAGCINPWNFAADTVTSSTTLYAKWTINMYTITASAGANGTITPSGSVSVPYGSSQSFTITPSLGYMIDTLTVDNVPVSDATDQFGYTETLMNVVSSHVISVTFKQIPDTQPPTVTLPDFGAFPGVSGYSGGSVPTFWVSTSPFNFQFTLDDNRGPVKWTITVNGVVVIDPVDIGSITYPVPLSEGRNDVVISARDAAGNATSKELIVYLDSMNPVLTLTPTLPASVTTPQLTITGSVADTGSGLKHFTINGTEAIRFLDGSFSEKLSLTKGANTIVLEAEDNVGHKVTSTYTVTYAVAGTSLPTVKTVTLTIGKTTMDVNGLAVALDAAPVLQNGRTLLPIRALIEVLGGKVTWNATTRAATVTLNGRTVSVTIGNPIGLVGGKKVPIDAANAKVVPIIINGRTFLPLRFIAENLGLDLTWEPVSRTISFTYWP